MFRKTPAQAPFNNGYPELAVNATERGEVILFKTQRTLEANFRALWNDITLTRGRTAN